MCRQRQRASTQVSADECACPQHSRPNSFTRCRLTSGRIWTEVVPLLTVCECVLPSLSVWVWWGRGVSAPRWQWMCWRCCRDLAALALWWCVDCPSRSVDHLLLAIGEEMQTKTHHHTVSSAAAGATNTTLLYTILRLLLLLLRICVAVSYNNGNHSYIPQQLLILLLPLYLYLLPEFYN